MLSDTEVFLFACAFLWLALLTVAVGVLYSRIKDHRHKSQVFR